MNDEDVTRWAREAGIPYDPWPDSAYNKNIERFAALAYAAGAAAEREACAVVAERHAIDREDEYVCDKIATAIRARGN